jgi:tight adherence protein B
MVIILIALLTFVLLASIGFLIVGDSSGVSQSALKRAHAITAAAPSNGAKRLKPQSKSVEERRKQIMTQLKEAEKRQRKERLTLRARMLHAGLEPDVRKFWIFSLILGIVAFVIALVAFQGTMLARLGVSLGAGFVTTYGLPRWILGFLAKGRMKKFIEEFPNAMDILVRGIKSGLPVNDGLKLISKECTVPLGPEFQRMVDNVAVGMSLEQGLEKMIERIPSPELRFFAIVIAIQAKTGGNLAEALNNLSNVLRARKMMREKIKALSAEAIASAGIIGSLPPLVGGAITIMRPAFIAPMFTDPRGHMMLMGGAVWMFLGIMMMRKMINFKM